MDGQEDCVSPSQSRPKWSFWPRCGSAAAATQSSIPAQVGRMFWKGWNIGRLYIPIGSMYAIYGNIYHQYNIPPMFAYIPYMDPMGYKWESARWIYRYIYIYMMYLSIIIIDYRCTYVYIYIRTWLFIYVYIDMPHFASQALVVAPGLSTASGIGDYASKAGGSIAPHKQHGGVIAVNTPRFLNGHSRNLNWRYLPYIRLYKAYIRPM